MTAKEYLRQLEMLNTKINQKLQQRVELKHMAECMNAIDYAKDKVQSSPGDTMTDAVTRYVMLEEEIDRQVDQFIDLKNLIINQIQGLKDLNHIKILFKRYVEFKRLEVIAVEMNYTYTYVRALHGHALQEFERTYTILHSSVL